MPCFAICRHRSPPGPAPAPSADSASATVLHRQPSSSTNLTKHYKGPAAIATGPSPFGPAVASRRRHVTPPIGRRHALSVDVTSSFSRSPPTPVAGWLVICRTRAPCAGRRCGTRVTPSSPLVVTDGRRAGRAGGDTPDESCSAAPLPPGSVDRRDPGAADNEPPGRRRQDRRRRGLPGPPPPTPGGGGG